MTALGMTVDVSAVYEKSKIKFRQSLLDWEIRNHTLGLSHFGRESVKSLLSFKLGLRPFYFYTAVMYFHRVVKQYDCDVLHKHNKNLSTLYGIQRLLPPTPRQYNKFI